MSEDELFQEALDEILERDEDDEDRSDEYRELEGDRQDDQK